MVTLQTTFGGSRLDYVIDYLSNRLDVTVIKADSNGTIGYGSLGSSLTIKDIGLLHDGGDISNDALKSLLVDVLDLLEVKGKIDKWPDVLSLIFWYLVRFEEYLPFEGDNHQRFTSKDSICSELGVIRRPIVDEIVFLLKAQLQIENSPNLKVIHQSTLDIDQPFAYAHKGFKVILGMAKDALKGNFQKVKWRTDSFISAYDDPYFTYEYIFDLHKEYSIKPIFFILSSYNKHKFDINHDPEDAPYRVVINMLSDQYRIGIHPSYHSSIDYKEVEKEKKRLQNIVSKPITASRQHFLRLSLPQTYRELIKSGISDDYTMGFSDDIGYRAGTGHLFQWYDLKAESTTSLTIHPFNIMDVTLKDYLKYQPDQAINVCLKLIDDAESFDSPVTIIWHNSSLHALGAWNDWKKVYEKIIIRLSRSY